MSNSWFTILGPKSWPGVSINTGNKKIDGQYFNVLGDKNIQLSASGNMWLVGGSGIQLISQGYVDVSGLRSKNLLYQQISKIDSSGNIIPSYPGSEGALIYKSGENDLAAIPGNQLVFNTGLNAITMPSQPYGPLYVSSGNFDNPNTHEIKAFSQIEYEPSTTIDSAQIPAKVTINAITKITEGIQIYPNFEGYKGNILTHMGKDQLAEWSPAVYLNADGVKWNRFSKRPVKVEDGRIIFYVNKPKWADASISTTALTQEILESEFGIGFDTIELMRNDTREIVYVKFAAEVRYGVEQDSIDLVTPLEDLYQEADFIDPDGEPDQTVQGLAIKICTPKPWSDGNSYLGNGYAFSVTKGAYMDMQLGRTAKNQYNCIQEELPTSQLKFKPSTLNSISIRPDTHTAFNMLGENIDFLVYGQRKTRYGNYDENIFGLNSHNIPVGMIPALKVDANVPNAASGSPSSGIYFVKYLDREKTNPSGWNYDTRAKVSINTSGAYVISSLPTGTYTIGEVTITGYVYDYADLTVDRTIYSPNIITEDIYLRPLPLSDNSGKYITNALLTIDKNGKIISRVPKTNPTTPGKPYGIILDPDSNGIGNSELSIKWNQPESDGNSLIINYIIQFSTNNGDTWTDIQSPYSVDRAKPESTRATIKGLSAATQYKFRISAQNLIGIGEYSDASSGMTPGSSVPKAPYNLAYVREFDSTIYSDIALSWEAGQNGSSPILGYRIEESYDAGISWQNYNDTSNLITSTNEVINGTESNINYHYRLSAYNSNGQSSYAYIYVSGNLISEEDPELAVQRENDLLSNWDFGSILFTGVCPT
jgi:hypothetical protein